MKAVTKEQCEAALGSISDAIEEYCVVGASLVIEVKE